MGSAPCLYTLSDYQLSPKALFSISYSPISISHAMVLYDFILHHIFTRVDWSIDVYA